MSVCPVACTFAGGLRCDNWGMGSGAGTEAHAGLVAWLSLLLVIPCFVLAFVVGEGLVGLLGYPVGTSVRPPLWAGAIATGLALVAFAIPLWPTWHYGRRARAASPRTAMLPFVIEAVLVTGFTVLNVVPMGQ